MISVRKSLDGIQQATIFRGQHCVTIYRIKHPCFSPANQGLGSWNDNQTTGAEIQVVGIHSAFAKIKIGTQLALEKVRAKEMVCAQAF